MSLVEDGGGVDELGGDGGGVEEWTLDWCCLVVRYSPWRHYLSHLISGSGKNDELVK